MALVVVIYQLLTALLELPTGALADLIGRKVTIALGYAISGCALVMIAFGDSIVMLFVWTAFRGLGASLISGAHNALFYDTLKEIGREDDYSKIQVNASILFQLGMVFSSILGGILFNLWVGLPYLMTGIFLLGSALGTTFMQEPKIDSEKFTFNNYLKQTWYGLKEITKNPYNKYLSSFYVLVGGFSWAAQLYLNQIFATSLGYESLYKGYLFGLIRFVNSILILKILNLPKLVTNKNAFIFFPVLLIISFLPGMWGDLIVGTFMLFGATLASTARFVIIDKLVNDSVVSKYRATSVSALNMLVSFTAAILLLLSGQLSDYIEVGTVYTVFGIVVTTIVLPLGILAYKKSHLS